MQNGRDPCPVSNFTLLISFYINYLGGHPSAWPYPQLALQLMFILATDKKGAILVIIPKCFTKFGFEYSACMHRCSRCLLETDTL